MSSCDSPSLLLRNIRCIRCSPMRRAIGLIGLPGWGQKSEMLSSLGVCLSLFLETATGKGRQPSAWRKLQTVGEPTTRLFLETSTCASCRDPGISITGSYYARCGRKVVTRNEGFSRPTALPPHPSLASRDKHWTTDSSGAFWVFIRNAAPGRGSRYPRMMSLRGFSSPSVCVSCA